MKCIRISLILLFLCLSVWPTLQAQKKEAPLTMAKILTGLQTEGDIPGTRTITERNKTLVQLVRKFGVTFTLTEERESDLKDAKASPELLKAIRENSPAPKPTPTLTPKPTPTPRSTLQSFVEDLGNGVKIEMVAVTGGTFQMGSEAGEADENPVHQVTVSAFAMGKYEVTQAQWQAVMGSKPSNFKGADLPVEIVSWEEAQAFCRELSRMTGKGYRMPTEAEWEYACRAGTKGPYAGTLSEMAWYSDNAGSRTHPVGQKKPNAWGLYDMHGNVWEWCQDWYDRSYYSQSSATDPQGPRAGSYRVVRGGGWSYAAADCRSAYRDYRAPGSRYGSLGFRLLRTAR